jgi:hypothetical protein
MWWLVGLVAFLAAAGTNTARNLPMGGVSRLPQGTSRMLTYRSRDGGAFFRFRFTMLTDNIRIHILQFPSPHVGSCHVLVDGQGPYICWSGPIRSLAEAEAVTAIWAEATLVYQRTGQVF